MSLPNPTSPRRLMHRRSLDMQAYARAGLFDLGAWSCDAMSTCTPMEREGQTDSHLGAPFQPHQCRALRSIGPMVQTHYPRWYRGGLAQAEPQALPASSS